MIQRMGVVDGGVSTMGLQVPRLAVALHDIKSILILLAKQGLNDLASGETKCLPPIPRRRVKAR